MEKLKQSIFNIIFYIILIAIILGLVFLLVFVIMKINVYAEEEINPKQTCILIDPGHGAEDGGAVSDSGLVEKEVNLSISNYLKEYLELSGYQVLMTRCGDTIMGDQSLPTVKERLRSDMNARLELYNSENVDYVISIHQNKFGESKYSGAQVFYSPNDEKSEKLADCMQRSIVGFLQPDNDRSIVKAGSNIYLLNNCSKPCILVECGFLSNPEETAKLAADEYQRQMAFSIYCGLLDCIRNSP